MMIALPSGKIIVSLGDGNVECVLGDSLKRRHCFHQNKVTSIQYATSALGYYIIWDVEPALFSPLMSTSNSLSGVVILGGILMASAEMGTPTNVLACASISVASINVFGGFAVSYRMLLMFKKET